MEVRAFNLPLCTTIPLKPSHSFAAIHHVLAFFLPVLRRWILLKLFWEFLSLCLFLQGFTFSSFHAVSLQVISFMCWKKSTHNPNPKKSNTYPNQYSSLKSRLCSFLHLINFSTCVTCLTGTSYSAFPQLDSFGIASITTTFPKPLPQHTHTLLVLLGLALVSLLPKLFHSSSRLVQLSSHCYST